jgi:hypothetical protein
MAVLLVIGPVSWWKWAVVMAAIAWANIVGFLEGHQEGGVHD